MHRRFFPDFLKNIRGLRAASLDVGGYKRAPQYDAKTQKELQKKAKVVEDRVDWILNYILFGEPAPTPPTVSQDSMYFTDLVSTIESLGLALTESVSKTYATREAAYKMDVKEAMGIIRDLQMMKILARSLR